MTTGIFLSPNSPKTLTSTTLDPEVIRSFAHPLPKKFENILHLFVNMDKVVSIAHRREMRITFANVSANVMKNTKMLFGESHLSQIHYVFPKAYYLNWEKHRQPIGKAQSGVNFDLVIVPNLKEDLGKYLISKEPTKRMDGWRLTCRKMLFRHLLVQRVKKVHQVFLSSDNLKLAVGQLIHPEFDIDSVPDLSPTKLPDKPKTDVLLRSMRDYLEALPVEESAVVVSKSLIKEENSMKDSPKTPQEKSSVKVKESPKTPKISLLERVRARENTLKSIKAQKDPEAEKRCAALQLLKQSMVEVICSHFSIKKVTGMNLRQLMPLVCLSCGQMDKRKFIQHIDVLCEVAPTICSTESFLGTTCLKLSEVRADKILAFIDEELCRLSEKFVPNE